MSLTSLWQSQKDELSAKHIQAMVGLAGDGRLRDGSKASDEFREFLTHVPSTHLGRYANECLQVQQILRLREYTKVDATIDLVFSAAEDVKKEELQIDSAEEGGKNFTPVNFREQCIARPQADLKTPLVK